MFLPVSLDIFFGRGSSFEDSIGKGSVGIVLLVVRSTFDPPAPHHAFVFSSCVCLMFVCVFVMRAARTEAPAKQARRAEDHHLRVLSHRRRGVRVRSCIICFFVLLFLLFLLIILSCITSVCHVTSCRTVSCTVRSLRPSRVCFWYYYCYIYWWQ